MPNWVTNRIEAPKYIIDELMSVDENGNDFFDFNTIILMPSNIFQGDLGQKERELYGSDNWYDWSYENWGTKWNASDSSRESDIVLTFNTAWAHPFPIINKISRMYPDNEFLIAYADEDMGYNLDVYTVKNGEPIKESSVAEGTSLAQILASLIIDWRDREEELEEEIESSKRLLKSKDIDDSDKKNIEEEIKYYSEELENFQTVRKDLKESYPHLDFTKVESFLSV